MNTYYTIFKPLTSDSTKHSNTFKQFPCLSVFDDFVESGLKGLRNNQTPLIRNLSAQNQ